MKTRKVTVRQDAKAIYVEYVDRAKHGRYLAAQFDAKDHNLKSVTKWVESQKNLIFVV